MQSTLTSNEADPHDIFVVEPDVVLAARADAAPDPISSLLAPPIHPAPDLAATASVPPVETNFRPPANDDIQIPRDIHMLGERPRGRWAGRAIIGFLFALGSAAAAAGWDHYGDTAKAMIADWTPFTLTASQPAANSGDTAQPAAPAVQAAAADQAPAQPAPVAQPAQADSSTAAAASPDSKQSLQAMAQDVASMGQQIAALKATIEQLKASQDQMAQQMARDTARTPVATAPAARTSHARPSQTSSVEPSLRAKVTAALSPRPAAPLRRPRPVYAPAQASAALPPAITAPPMQPAPAPLQYEPRAQVVDQADGDPVMRPPMPVR